MQMDVILAAGMTAAFAIFAVTAVLGRFADPPPGRQSLRGQP